MSIYSHKWHMVPDHLVKQNGTVKIKAADLNELINRMRNAEYANEQHRRRLISLHAYYAGKQAILLTRRKHMKIDTLYQKQTELIELIAPVEADNSPLLSAKQILGMYTRMPQQAVLDDRVVQLRIKESAYRFQEELAEVIEAVRADNKDQVQEELVDCLHFLLELSLLASLPCPQDEGTMSMLFDVPLPGAFDVTDLIYSVGMAMQCLKNKPWKRTLKQTNIQEFHIRVGAIWVAFGELCGAAGMNAEMMYEGYFAKHLINEQRQHNGY